MRTKNENLPMTHDPLYQFLQSWLFRMEPELAHKRAFQLLQWAPKSLIRLQYPKIYDPVTLAGLPFFNRVGLAAGLDKNAEFLSGLAALGFGFIEVGTVTPLPQSGNPMPRLFRLPKVYGLINRLGFPSLGLEAVVKNLKITNVDSIVGVNIGKNKETTLENAYKDYSLGLAAVAPVADYVTVNLSSPNTPQLRELQFGAHLEQLLSVLTELQLSLQSKYSKPLPLFIKIAPDLEEQDIKAMTKIILKFPVAGVVATNTTVNKKNVADLPYGSEEGGLSGTPLLSQSTLILDKIKMHTKDTPLVRIGVGGIMSPDEGLQKIAAGADLVQMYTGLIYKGPKLIGDVAKAIRDGRRKR